MDAHVTALLTWAGPGVFSILGFIAFHAARAAFRSFERVIRDNSSAHEAMIEQLRRHEITLHSHEIRIDDHAREHLSIRSRADAQQAEINSQGQRIARLEAGSEIATRQ